MWQKLIDLQGEIDDSTVTVGDSNTALSEMDRSSRQKISKDMVELNHTVNKLYIIDICRLLIQQHIGLKLTHGTITKVYHIRGHKAHFNKFRGLEIIQCLPSDHNGMKLEINNRKIAGKSQNPWRLNNTLLNSTQMKEEIPRKFFKYSE